MLEDKAAAVWTLQQFTTLAGKAWFALQRHNDSSVVQQITGYSHEIEQHLEQMGITPEVLPSTTEEEFLKRGMVDRELDAADNTDDSPEAVFCVVRPHLHPCVANRRSPPWRPSREPNGGLVSCLALF
jgi:hypothetical protein